MAWHNAKFGQLPWVPDFQVSGGAAAFTNGFSLAFDGVDEYVTLGNNYDFERTNAFSVSLWIKFNNVASSRMLFSKMTGSANTGYLAYLNGGIISWAVQKTFPTNSCLVSTAAAVVTTATWYHFLFVYAGDSNASNMRIYKNASNVTSTIDANTLSQSIVNAGSLEFGRANFNGSPNWYLNGFMDEVRIYSAALSGADATTIYNAGHPGALTAVGGVSSAWRYGDSPDATGASGIGDRVGVIHGTMTNMESGDIQTDVP